jgi:hypothetical protein
MNREYKFRAKDEYGNWCYGLLTGNINNLNLNAIFTLPFHGIYPVIKGTEGQYTGLKDNNYTEIYEGDIVELLTEVEEYGVVKYSDGAFYVEADGFRVNFYDNIRGGDVIVIGNVWDNPEFLGGKK